MGLNAPKYDALDSKVLREVLAIVWMGLGILTMLALISYDRNDYWWHTTSPNNIMGNFIGPVGAYWSYALFFVLGLAAYLIPVLFFGAGLVLFFGLSMRWGWKLLWASLLVISAACLLDLQQAFGRSWAAGVNMTSPGGLVGGTLNSYCLRYLLNEVGAAIVLSVIYSVSLILLFDLQPRAAWQQFNSWLEAYRERRARERAAHDPIAAKDWENMEIEKQMRELRQQLEARGLSEAQIEAAMSGGAIPDKPKKERGRKKNEEPIATEEAAASEPEPAAPPKIIDSSRPEPAPEPAPEPEISELTGEETPEPRKKIEPVEPPADATIGTGATLIENYRLPSLGLLDVPDLSDHPLTSEHELHENSRLLVTTLQQFGINVKPGPITKGPSITRYEVYPDLGVRVEKILSLKRNIARVMKAEKINILAPIPGKDSVGIEIANSNKVPVLLRDLFESSTWHRSDSKIPIALGKDVYGHTLIGDLAAMPHVLIGGSTGSGKSVCINCVLMSLLYRFPPDEMRLILVDPKQVEMQIYNTIPHLVVPVVTDPKKVLMALRWVIKEMEERYQILAKTGVRNVHSFNKRDRSKEKSEQMDLGSELGLEENGEGEGTAVEVKPPVRVPREDDLHIPDRLPYIVVIIDELADLMQTASKEVEEQVQRIAQKARAAGIHLILATQTPRKDVITGTIKTNIPSRIAFQVPSALDSRVILDASGAENLLGKGDLLHVPPGSSRLVRAQGAFVSDDEVQRVVDFCAEQGAPSFEQEIHRRMEGNAEEILGDLSEGDIELLHKAFDVLSGDRKASTSHIQRRLRIGYNRAAWAMDQFEQLGILAEADPDAPGKPREILVDLDSYVLPI